MRAFAFSPDGQWIVSANDGGIRVWDAVRGDMVVMLPLPGPTTSVAVHPWLPRAVCGGSDGAVYRMTLIGIDFGPIIVTPVDRGNGPRFRCPKCRHEHRPERGQQGATIDCPVPGCDLTLRVAPFIVGSSSPPETA